MSSILPPILKVEKLYDAKEHGFTAAEFHKRCNGKAPTVIITKATTGNIFGGYSAIPWKGAGEYMSDTKNKVRSFLFSVTHRTSHEYTHAGNHEIYFNRYYGPTFGVGHDLCIKGSNKGNYASLGYSYSCPAGMQYGSDDAKQYLVGDYSFTIDNYEVFSLSLNY